MSIRSNIMRSLWVALSVALIVGCATAPEPFEYEPDNELKPGPGLFSGEDGAFTVYSNSRQPEEEPADESNITDK